MGTPRVIWEGMIPAVNLFINVLLVTYTIIVYQTAFITCRDRDSDIFSGYYRPKISQYYRWTNGATIQVEGGKWRC